MATDDIEEACDELVAKGVPFDCPPREHPGGKQAVFRDPDGNGLVLWGRR